MILSIFQKSRGDNYSKLYLIISPMLYDKAAVIFKGNGGQIKSDQTINPIFFIDIAVMLFVHIPKTAGTSFRQGMLEVFGRKALLFDYGPDAPETDVSIRMIY